MISVVFALLPVFLVIALGHLLKRIAFLPEEGWAGFDRINYFVFFPALIIHAVATADFTGDTVLRVGGVLFAAVIVVAGLLVLVRPLLTMSLMSFSSLFQNCIRWNGFVALASALTLLGPEGLTLVAIAIAVIVPTVNVLSVMVLTHGAGTGSSARQLLRTLVRNPLIIGCLIGISLNVTGIGLPGPTEGVGAILGRAALALGLLSVGAGIDLGRARSDLWSLTAGTFIKLIAMPALVLGLALLAGLEGLELSAVMLVASVPTATSGYVLARQLGGDAPLMAGFVTATSLGAMVTMPLWLAIVR